MTEYWTEPTSRAGKPWAPSNQANGNLFIKTWCSRCIHDSDAGPCPILGAAVTNGYGGPGPAEWVYNPNGLPMCKAFEARPLPDHEPPQTQARPRERNRIQPARDQGSLID